MVKVIQKRYFKSIVYTRVINGELKEYEELFFDDKYAFIRADEIEKGLYEIKYELTPNMLVLDYFDIYLKSVSFKSNTKRTYETYVSIIKNYCVPYFKMKTLQEIDQKFVINLNKEIENQRMIGQNHINEENRLIGSRLKGEIKSLLNKMFSYATEKGMYSINPMQYLKSNYKTSRFSTDWDLTTLQMLFDISSGQRLSILLHCLFGTDLLIKEILAMTWNQVFIDDMNLARNSCYIEADRYLGRKRLNDIKEMREKVIKVFPAVINESGQTRLVIYKSEKSRRIYIPIKIAKILKEWKKYQDKEKSLIGESYENNNLVIALSNGKACEDRIIKKELDALKVIYKLPDVKLAKLKTFSKKRVVNGETTLTIREYFYLTCDENEYATFYINGIRKKVIQTKRLINDGDYQFVDLKNIEIPTRKNLDILKAISLIKSNPNYANQLASILKE